MAQPANALQAALPAPLPSRTNLIDPQRPGDVLDLDLAHVLEGKGEAVSHLAAHVAMHPDAAGSASPSIRAAMFTPSPKMSPSSMTMSPMLMPMRKRIFRSSGTSRVCFGHGALDFDGAFDRRDDAGELRQ